MNAFGSGKGRQDAEFLAVVKKLARPLCIVGETEDAWQMRADGQRGRPSRIGKALLIALEQASLVQTNDKTVLLTKEGRAWLKRALQPDHAFRAQHGRLAVSASEGDDGSLLRDEDSSPLARLARLAQPHAGRPAFFAPHQMKAADRLAHDVIGAGMMPRVTANWSSARTGRARAGGAQTSLQDAALDARRRVTEAMKAVGPEFSGLLFDVCCMHKPLGVVEGERQWPARSAKVALALGLARLARHYGYDDTARGAERSRTRHWAEEGYRPSLKRTK